MILTFRDIHDAWLKSLEKNQILEKENQDLKDRVTELEKANHELKEFADSLHSEANGLRADYEFRR